MNTINAIILGLVQGLTEFLPVSSSGHLVIVSRLIGSDSSLVFDLFLHGVSLVAVLIFFRKKLMDLLTAVLYKLTGKKSDDKNNDFKLVIKLLVASIPAALFGILFEDKVTQLFVSAKFAGMGLLVTALLLYASDRYSPKNIIEHKIEKDLTSIGWFSVLFIGFLQALAILPGISRSGSTFSAGLFCGVSRKEAANFSFLMSIPVIGGAFLMKLKDISSLDMPVVVLIAGGLACFISAYWAISFFMKIISTKSLKGFAAYCFVVALTVLIFLK